jgi:uncharacterized protein (DUF58 family)
VTTSTPFGPTTGAPKSEGLVSVAGKAEQLRRLELLVTRRLDGLLRGEFLGLQPGPGTEPYGTRNYEAGDDARRIDWNLSARSLQPQLRTTEADRELQTWVVVDKSASMNFGTALAEKSEIAFAGVAAFGFLIARYGNRFGIMVAGGDEVVRLGPASTRAQLLAELSRLYDIPRRETQPSAGANLEGALAILERAHPRRGQIIVISDFLEESDWPRILTRLSYGHQVLCVQVTDPRELALPPVGMLTVVDTETGKRMNVQSNSSKLRERYAAAAAARDDTIKEQVRRARSEHLTLSTDRDWLLDIVKYVASRRTLQRGAPRSLERAGSLRSVK